MTQKNADKNKAKTGVGQRYKGKSPASNVTTPNHPPPTQAVANQARSNVQNSTNPNARGRGGRHGASRGKGRGSGRGVTNGHIINGLDLTSVGWSVPGCAQGVFQFGGTSGLTDMPAGEEMAGAGGRGRQPSAVVELLAKAADEGRRTPNEAAPFTATHSHWLPRRWSALPSPPLCFIVDYPASCRLVRTREMGMGIGLDFWK
nr:LINE-type retrotransposon LIb DNA [Ipomoea batatas]